MPPSDDTDLRTQAQAQPVPRPPYSHEAPECRALLPAAFPASGEAPELLVVPGLDRLRAVAAMAWMPGSFQVLVYVSPSFRRHGLGSALVAGLVRIASGETPAIRTWGSVEESSVNATFLQAVGFKVKRRLLVFESDNLSFERSMASLLVKLRASGRIPPETKLVPLDQAPIEAVTRLVAPHLDVMPHEIASRMSRVSSYQYDKRQSLVVIHGTQVVGAMLCRYADGVLEVDARVVDPAYRQGVANLLLLEGMARNFRLSGARRCRFSCEPHISDTISLARRCSAVSLPSQLVMFKSMVDGSFCPLPQQLGPVTS